ncbi:MAG: sulfotransferase family 2 domain-containing protein [Pseudomonadota bacterium]
MMKEWIARRLTKWFGGKLTRQIAAQHMKTLRAGQASRPAKADSALSELPDLAKRRAFFQEHILVHTHIPKTAGSSLSAGLAAIVGGVHFLDVRLPRSVPLSKLTQEDLDDIYCISSHMGFGMHDLFDRKPLYLAAVRDPVDRAVSYYRYLQNRPNEEMSKHAIGKSFEESWRLIDADRGEAHRNLQARMLVSRIDDKPLDEDLMWRRVNEDYLLLIPHNKVSKALEDLRAAFGVFRTPDAKVNVSRSVDVKPSPEIIKEIRAVNQVDAKLHSHVVANFKENLQSACQTIAHHCLQRIDGDT